MQNTKTVETSENSQPNLALRFRQDSFDFFEVEHAEDRGDIVYHFWPIAGQTEFAPGFAKALEDGFKKILPSTAKVRAEYMDKIEAAVLLKVGEKNEDAIPRETFYVRVIGWADNPMVDRFLRQRVFEEIDRAAKERLNDHLEKR